MPAKTDIAQSQPGSTAAQNEDPNNLQGILEVKRRAAFWPWRLKDFDGMPVILSMIIPHLLVLVFALYGLVQDLQKTRAQAEIDDAAIVKWSARFSTMNMLYGIILIGLSLKFKAPVCQFIGVGLIIVHIDAICRMDGVGNCFPFQLPCQCVGAIPVLARMFAAIMFLVFSP